MRLRYSAESVEDLYSIALDGTRRVGSAASNRFIARLRRSIESTMGRLVTSGRSRPELGSGIRSFPFAPYVVICHETRNVVTVLRILHGHRDIKEPLMSLLLAV
jgi:toxin ParE1/3/4